MKMDIDRALFEESKPQSFIPLLKAPEKFEPEEIEQAVLRNFANMALFSAIIADTALGRNFAFEEPPLNLSKEELTGHKLVADWIYQLRNSFKGSRLCSFSFYKEYSKNSLADVFGTLLVDLNHGQENPNNSLNEAAYWLLQQARCLSPAKFDYQEAFQKAKDPVNNFKLVLSRHLISTTLAFDTSLIKEAPVEIFYLTKWVKIALFKLGLKISDPEASNALALALDQAPDFYGPFSL